MFSKSDEPWAEVTLCAQEVTDSIVLTLVRSCCGHKLWLLCVTWPQHELQCATSQVPTLGLIW